MLHVREGKRDGSNRNKINKVTANNSIHMAPGPKPVFFGNHQDITIYKSQLKFCFGYYEQKK